MKRARSNKSGKHTFKDSDIICSNNNQIHTVSENDDREAWVDVEDALSPEEQALVRKQRAIILRKAKTDINKEIATRHILTRKVSKKVSRTLSKYSNIGKQIEEYVKQKRVGADQSNGEGLACSLLMET